jgi:hypothetical protein
VYDYDAAKGPKIYAGKNWPKPTTGPLNMTIAEADAVPLVAEVPQASLFTAGNVRAIITPRQLTRADILVLRMIKDAAGTVRPFYFSRTSGGYAGELGMGQYTLTQGLAKKLVNGEIRPSPDTLAVGGEGFLDVRRTKALWDSVFTATKSIARRTDWVDQPSVGIPYLYVSTGAILSDALQRTGQPQEAQKVMAEARAVAKATRLDDLLARYEQAAEPVNPFANDTAGRIEVPLAPQTAPPIAPKTSGKKP